MGTGTGHGKGRRHARRATCSRGSTRQRRDDGFERTGRNVYPNAWFPGRVEAAC